MHHKKNPKYSTTQSIKELNSWAGIKCKRRDLIFLKRQPQKNKNKNKNKTGHPGREIVCRRSQFMIDLCVELQQQGVVCPDMTQSQSLHAKPQLWVLVSPVAKCVIKRVEGSSAPICTGHYWRTHF